MEEFRKKVRDICSDITDEQLDKLIHLMSVEADKYADQLISDTVEHALYSIDKYGR